MQRRLATLGVVALSLSGACRQPRTRAMADAADLDRRCGLPDTSGAPEAQAVRCAEWFIARQGYTLAPAIEDTTRVVTEGIEWESSVRERLARRRGSLQPTAFGICPRSDGGYDVAFRTATGVGARGVSMDSQFGSLRVEHQDFEPDAITQHRGQCHPLTRGAQS